MPDSVVVALLIVVATGAVFELFDVCDYWLDRFFARRERRAFTERERR